MIPLDKLAAVTTLVCHKDCADGLASALILRHVLPDARVQFVQYSTQEHRELLAGPNMLFCDFSPDAARADEFVKAGAIVLDHHRTQKDVVAKFGELGVYADEEAEPGVSGAVLAFRHVWQPLAYRGAQRPANHPVEGHMAAVVEHLAMLAGVRDTWQKQSSMWEAAQIQAAALTFFEPEEMLAERTFFETIAQKHDIGRVLVAKRDKTSKRIAAEAYFTKTKDGTRIAIVPTIETSDVAEAIAVTDADITIGFAYRAERAESGNKAKLIVSMRSRGLYDVSKIAKAHGGGGHTKAAGFTVEISSVDIQPFAFIQKLVDNYEQEQPF